MKCAVITAWLQDIPLMFQALELPLKYIIIYKYTQIYVYTATLVLDDEICVSFPQLNQNQQITEIFFSLQL